MVFFSAMKSGVQIIARASIFLTLMLLPVLGHAQEKQITLKLGTLGPAGTSVAIAVESLLEGLDKLGQNMGYKIKIQPYYGGVMGDEPEMNQKAKLGQLDILTPTLSTMPDLVPSIEPYYLPFLVNTFGEFDYMAKRKFLKEITTDALKKGFFMIGFVTEAMYDLYYLHQDEIRTPEQARTKLKAANWSGTPHDNFWIPLGIPQVPVSVPEAPTYAKMGMVNATVSPALWVIGVQLYTLRPTPTIVQPSMWTGGAGVMLTKSKFDALPWDFKIGFAGMLPLFMYVANGQLRDGHFAFIDAMLKYGCKKLELTEAEIKAWKDPCIAYRKKYLGSNPVKRHYYNMITSTLDEYRKAPSIEKAMYENDPQYGNFPKKLQAVAHALRTYLETGSLDELASLEAKNVIEKWRLHDLLVAAKGFAQTGDIKPLRACFEGFLPDAILEEIFSKHTQELKRLFGTEEAIKARVGEYLTYIESKKYRGYQKRTQ
ncbi:MAG: TRAP transporter substrate-binding protein DctP [Nitrospirota bacterium]|nr:TRAP transporter substrate-binding protein DctP [Nitrospirota bacterium]